MRMMPLHLHFNQKSDYDDDGVVQWKSLYIVTVGWLLAKIVNFYTENAMYKNKFCLLLVSVIWAGLSFYIHLCRYMLYQYIHE